MRTILIAAATAILALGAGVVRAAPSASGNSGLEAELIAMEKQSWVAWQGHDAAFFDRFLSDDHVEMQGFGPTGKAPVVAGVKSGCTVTSYQVDHFKLTRFGPDTALLTYRAEQDTTCGPGKVPSPVWATSLFVRRGGRWQNALYVHSPAAK
ncbi:MAG TPA: nuclear transport factor 2 family protein [Phenylobacterium sp.]|jgi:hypothetical protein